MNRKTAEEIYTACERAIVELSAAEKAILQIQDSETRSRLLRALGSCITEIFGTLRMHAVRQYPDLEPQQEHGEPDTALDAEDLAAVSLLSTSDIEAIDKALLAECAQTWRKVARVVGFAMTALRGRFQGVPDSYYALRVISLAESGVIESQGNLHYMRFSEVRLPQS